jgi:hypothetical protein
MDKKKGGFFFNFFKEMKKNEWKKCGKKWKKLKFM